MAEFNLEKYIDEMNKLYPIGEEVSVTDAGKIYPSYFKMFERLGFKSPKVNGYHFNHTIRRWKVFTPVVQHMDYIDPCLLVGIESGDDQLLIDINGLGSYNNKYTELQKLNLTPEQIYGVLHFIEKYYDLK